MYCGRLCFYRLIFHNMKTHKDQLTARQQQFCQVYVGAAQRNAALAARMAGYAAASSHVTGCQLLQTPKVAAAVRALEAVNAQDLQVTRKEVLARLKLEKGDTVYVTETPDGVALTPLDPAFAQQLEIGRDFMREYRDTFRALAK